MNQIADKNQRERDIRQWIQSRRFVIEHVEAIHELSGESTVIASLLDGLVDAVRLQERLLIDLGDDEGELLQEWHNMKKKEEREELEEEEDE